MRFFFDRNISKYIAQMLDAFSRGDRGGHEVRSLDNDRRFTKTTASHSTSPVVFVNRGSLSRLLTSCPPRSPLEKASSICAIY